MILLALMACQTFVDFYSSDTDLGGSDTQVSETGQTVVSPDLAHWKGVFQGPLRLSSTWKMKTGSVNYHHERSL